MKTLVVYSSRTGNTRKVAEAIAQVLPNAEIYPVSQAPDAEGYDFVALGYWVRRGGPNNASSAYMATVKNAKVALFGTLGAWPDSPHAAQCRQRGEELLKEPERGNRVLGTFLCQGKVDPKVVEKVQERGDSKHPMTPERMARLAEAAKHPDEEDLRQAQEAFRAFLQEAMRGQ
ncbi:MAG: flavodoxin family protein [Desulfovibrionaceae bacterium]|nr:flavodoxin family protein [Desulfovibrionaceae bacterium]